MVFENVLWIGTGQPRGHGGGRVWIATGTELFLDYQSPINEDTGMADMSTINAIVEFEGDMFACGWGYSVNGGDGPPDGDVTSIVLRRTGGDMGEGVWEEVHAGNLADGGGIYEHQMLSLAIHDGELYAGGMVHKFWLELRLHGRLLEWNDSSFDYVALSDGAEGWTGFASLYSWGGDLHIGDNAGPRFGYYDGTDFIQTWNELGAMPGGASGTGHAVSDFIEYNDVLYAAVRDSPLWSTSDGTNWTEGPTDPLYGDYRNYSLEIYQDQLYIGTARQSDQEPFDALLLRGTDMLEVWRVPSQRYVGLNAMLTDARDEIMYIGIGQRTSGSGPGNLYGMFGGPDNIVQLYEGIDRSILCLHGDGPERWQLPGGTPPPWTQRSGPAFPTCENLNANTIGQLYVSGCTLIDG